MIHTSLTIWSSENVTVKRRRKHLLKANNSIKKRIWNKDGNVTVVDIQKVLTAVKSSSVQDT